jgi:hypothetical protein
MANKFTYTPPAAAGNMIIDPQYYGAYSYYKPPYFYYGGGGSAPAAPQAPPPAAAAPASPTSTVSDLQVLIASIPIAQDGQVISADHHNSVRVAFIAMANRLGLGLIAEEIVETFAPRLSAMPGGAAWEQDIGAVKKPTTGTGDTGALRGWMDVDLPDGSRIKKLQVYASTESDNGTMRVKLRRQSVSNVNASDDLTVIEVTNNDATTVKEGDVTLPDSTGSGDLSAIEQARIVDKRKYKYLLLAELDTGHAGKNARINSVQVVLGK